MMGAAVFLMIGTFDALWAIVLDDLDAGELIANAGITLFALPLIFLGSYGGRLAQRIGPFRLGPLGLLLGAVFMFPYGLLPTGIAMFSVGVVHAISDGITVSSTGVAVAVAAPPARQAGAQGMLGAAETLTAGITAVVAGVLYSWAGARWPTPPARSSWWRWRSARTWWRGPSTAARSAPEQPVVLDPATAVTGHA